MRFARIGPPGAELPAVAGPDGRWHDLRTVTADVTAEFVAAATDTNGTTLTVDGGLTSVQRPTTS